MGVTRTLRCTTSLLPRTIRLSCLTHLRSRSAGAQLEAERGGKESMKGRDPKEESRGKQNHSQSNADDALIDWPAMPRYLQSNPSDAKRHPAL